MVRSLIAGTLYDIFYGGIEMNINDDSKLIYESIFGTNIQFANKIEKKDIDIVRSQIREVNNCNLDKCDLYNEHKIVNFSDAPDFFVVFNDFVLAIEHFTIDSSKLTKKGYKYNQHYCEEYYKKIHSEILEGDINVSRHVETIQTDLKYEYLLENFYSIFNKHYKQIEKYKKNIRRQIEDKNKPIFIVFFIVYSVKLPSQIYYDETIINVFPHNDIKLYEFLADKNEIRGIIVNHDIGRIESRINRYISLKACEQEYYKIDNDKIFDLMRMGVYDYKKSIDE